MVKTRPRGFLDLEEIVAAPGEIFDYVKELHDYLWKFIRAICPGASGTLDDVIDLALAAAAPALSAHEIAKQIREWAKSCDVMTWPLGERMAKEMRALAARVEAESEPTDEMAERERRRRCEDGCILEAHRRAARRARRRR